MSFTDTQTLDDASGDDVVYALVSRDAQGTVRRDVATTNAAPGLLTIKHTKSGAGVNAIDRHLVQFSRTVQDSENVPRTAVINFTMSVPQASVITATIVNDLVANLVDLIADGGFTGSGMAGITALTQLGRGEA